MFLKFGRKLHVLFITWFISIVWQDPSTTCMSRSRTLSNNNGNFYKFTHINVQTNEIYLTLRLNSSSVLFQFNALNRILAHVFIGFIFGYLYWDVGVGANTILANYVYIYGTLLLTVYTGMMPVTLSCKYNSPVFF